MYFELQLWLQIFVVPAFLINNILEINKSISFKSYKTYNVINDSQFSGTICLKWK